MRNGRNVAVELQVRLSAKGRELPAAAARAGRPAPVAQSAISREVVSASGTLVNQ